MPPRRRRPWAPLVLAVTAMATAATMTAPGASAADATDRATPEKDVTTHRITLVTGDVVTVTGRPGDQRPAISVDPTGPSRGTAQISHTDGATHVVPLAANEAVAAGAVDMALFDVDGLIADGYDDARTSALPVLLRDQRGGAQPVAPAPARVRHRLESIHAVGASVPKRQAASFWRASDTAGERRAAHIGKIWLDAKVRVELADSVPQIGAPEVWKSGYDGKGVKVAVLDTGVDATHPDLKGRVSVQKNFTAAADTVDHFGHGTHVAATIGGSGAGNGAKGVAPGADLMVGKVLGDDGTGAYSDIVDGMEWAAAGGADIISMSLGSSVPDDGTGPVSAAADRLTEEYGSLFVVAAGNSGPHTIGQPASASQALTVGAVDKSDALAGFSSTGPRVGDYAVKPEVTAPGVDIVAARAAGTTMGTPVDDLYTSASGTSMATPHVAGAAALLKEIHPAWSAERIKTALVNSSERGGYRAEQGGAGRINVPRAAGQRAHASPATLTLGAVRYAEDGAYRPVSGVITLHNDTDTAQVFSLTAEGTDASGTAMPGGSLALDASTVTIPAGGDTKVTLSVDPNPLTRETSYSGIVTAAAGDPSTSLRVPFSLHLEPLLYELDITGIGRDGAAAGGPSQVVLLGEQTGRSYTVGFRKGVATARVRPDVYSVQTMIYTPEGSGQWIESAAASYRTGVDLTARDAAYTLDARTAGEVKVDTGRATERLGSALSYYRTGTNRGSHDLTTLISPDVKHLHLFPSPAPAAGSQEVTVHSTLVAPQLTATVQGRPGTRLTPTPLDGARKVEGRRSLRLVDVKGGTDAEFARRNVRGALVLATRSSATTIARIIDTAKARGAAAVAVSHAGPGRLAAEAGSQALPAFALYGEDGAALSRLAASHEGVVITLNGTPYSPFVYQLAQPLTGAIPAREVRLGVDAARTARITARVYGRGTGDGVSILGERRRTNFSWVLGTVPTRLGAVQERWVSADPGTIFQNGLDVGGYTMWESGVHTYEPATHRSEDWLKAVNNPRIDAAQPSWFEERYNGSTGKVTLTLAARPFTDTDPDHWSFLDARDRSGITLFKDGQRIAQSDYWYSTFTVPAGKARYTAVSVAERSSAAWGFGTRTTTSWSLEAGGVTSGGSRISMPQIAYDVPVGLDNRVRAGERQTLTVDARSWFDGGPDVTGVKVWASYDDGRTWQPLRPTATADAGRYRATFTAPAKGSSGYVSLRTRAVDTHGNTADQTVDRAFGLK